MFFETTLTTERIESMRSTGQWSDEHLYDRFAARVADRGDEALIVDRFGSLSWRDAASIVDGLSRGLLELGIRPRDVVQLQLPNRREFPLAVLALERIGAVVNPVAPIFRTKEVSVMSALARPRAVITVEEFRGYRLGDMHRRLREESSGHEGGTAELGGGVEHLIVATDPADDRHAGAVGDPAGPDALSFADLVALGERSTLTDEALELCRPSPDDVCEIMFTSGTTGQPKGVLHTQNTVNVATDLWLARVAPDCSRFHMASTLAHQTGYLYGIRAPISAGGSVVYQEVWDPTAFAQLIETHRIEASMGATPFLADLLGVDDLDRRDLSSFRAFVCAGAAIPLPVLEEARDRLPCTVMPGWGMTETGLSTTGRRDDPFAKLATDGQALDGNEVRVVDPDGRPVAAGVEGDLQFRGSEAFVGYLQGRELTESCWRDGWFDTGDRAVMDDDGYISISGRTKDLVIRGGENVPVKEVEDVLLRHPSIAGVAVIAKPHDRLGEIGCAVVIAADGRPDLGELTSFLDAQGVTRQFWPEELIVVDEFPMTPSGKIQKYLLRQQVLGA